MWFDRIDDSRGIDPNPPIVLSVSSDVIVARIVIWIRTLRSGSHHLTAARGYEASNDTYVDTETHYFYTETHTHAQICVCVCLEKNGDKYSSVSRSLATVFEWNSRGRRWQVPPARFHRSCIICTGSGELVHGVQTI